MKRKIASVLATTALALGGLAVASAPATALTTSAPGCLLVINSYSTKTTTSTSCSWGQARTRHTSAAGTTGYAYGAKAKNSATGEVPSWMKNQSAGRAIDSAWYVA
ncbi:hypothetical protein ATJ88_0420 [Isoptericola jiangsuensis]|uniref:Lactococcin 972 family bacteriocin n=1 Tax=Isoptericola jiangsuensis TaxID=548579 RepID=A0A2A9ERL7_9MICO|nr:hypothetical protein [Isoptericola jiangsuensis]PFG41777.1 hypothetical protein ATJ88_0420 [Isoptericola jiangsuensis]